MGRIETPIQVKIFKAIGSRIDTRLFRNNVGQAQYKDGSMVKYGLCNPGGSDLVGWHSKKITPDMIGKRVAIFTAIETKAPSKKPTPPQKNFIDRVKRAGGLAGVASNEKEALKIIDNGINYYLY